MTPWDRDPVTGESYLIKDGPYPLRDPGASNSDMDYFLTKAMRERYQSQQPAALAGSFMADIGLPMRVTAKPVDKIIGSGGGEAVGQWDPDGAQILFNPAAVKTPEAKTAMLAHELSHAADYAQTFGQFRGERGSYESKAKGLHHAGLEDVEGELAGLMTAQAQLERGQAINPDFYRYYPGLKRVHPLSSNPLAGPWDFQHR